MAASSSEDITTPSHPALLVCLLLYALPLLVGVVGNVGLMHVIITQKTLRTANNAYIASMAVLDLLACTLLVPLRLLFYLALPSIQQAGTALCQADIFFRSLVDAGRMLLLAAISFERYQAVANPFQRDKTAAARRAFIILGALWFSVTVYAAVITLFLNDTIMFEFCMKQASEEADDYFLWGGIEIYFVLPMSLATVVVIIICYVLMFRVFYTQRAKMLGHTKKDSNKVAPVSGSVLRIKAPSGPVDVSKGKPLSCVSVKNVTSVSAAASNLATADAGSAVTRYTVSPVKALQGQAGREECSGSVRIADQTVKAARSPVVVVPSESVTQAGTTGTAEQKTGLTVLSSSNIHSLMPNPSASETLRPSSTSPSPSSSTSCQGGGEGGHLQKTSKAGVSNKGRLQSPTNKQTVAKISGQHSAISKGQMTDCGDSEHNKPMFLAAQTLVTVDGTSVAGHSSASVSQLTGTQAGCREAADTAPSWGGQTPALSRQCSDASTSRSSGSGLLRASNVNTGETDHRHEDLPRQDHIITSTQGQHSTLVPASSPASSGTDKYLQITSIQTLDVSTPTITPLETPENVQRREKAVESASLVTGKPAGEDAGNAETQSSNFPASEDVSTASKPQPSPPGQPADIPKAPLHKESSIPPTEDPMKMIKVVEADGSEHSQKVSSSQNIQGDVCMFNPKNRELGRRKMEGRVAKRLVIIFLTFLLLWLPYPCAVLALHSLYMQAHPSSAVAVPQTVTDVIAVLSALSMVTAAINPVFYGLANTTIRAIILRGLKKVCTCCWLCKPQSA